MLLLQCVTPASFAAKGHTTNNGGNLAEIRFTDAWRNFESRMAPCLTPQNICRLNARQLATLKSAVQNKPSMPMVMPSEGLLYHDGGAPKSDAEMYEVVLAILQDCGSSLNADSIGEISARALAVTSFAGVQLFRGQTWFVFQRKGLFVEYTGGVQDFTQQFRSLLKLPTGAPVNFERVWIRNNGGLIEISGRVIYTKDVQKDNGFTLLINPFEDGTIPARTSLTVFR